MNENDMEPILFIFLVGASWTETPLFSDLVKII